MSGRGRNAILVRQVSGVVKILAPRLPGWKLPKGFLLHWKVQGKPCHTFCSALSPACSAQAPLTYWLVPTCYLCSAHRASCSSLPALHMSPWRPSSITPKMHPSTHHFLSCKDALSSSYHSVPWNHLCCHVYYLVSSLREKHQDTGTMWILRLTITQVPRNYHAYIRCSVKFSLLFVLLLWSSNC